MTYDRQMLALLANWSVEEFHGSVYRATRRNLDPLTPSMRGGRWMRPDETSVLYTALSFAGAVAELAFHWRMLSPWPSKKAIVSTLQVSLKSSIRVVHADFDALGVDRTRYGSLDYTRMQEIGAAAASLGLHGIIVPSARWECENLVIFTNNLDQKTTLKTIDSKDIDWITWSMENGSFGIKTRR